MFNLQADLGRHHQTVRANLGCWGGDWESWGEEKEITLHLTHKSPPKAAVFLKIAISDLQLRAAPASCVKTAFDLEKYPPLGAVFHCGGSCKGWYPLACV